MSVLQPNTFLYLTLQHERHVFIQSGMVGLYNGSHASFSNVRIIGEPGKYTLSATSLRDPSIDLGQLVRLFVLECAYPRVPFRFPNEQVDRCIDLNAGTLCFC
jgi:hypothetical protein